MPTSCVPTIRAADSPWRGGKNTDLFPRRRRPCQRLALLQSQHLRRARHAGIPLHVYHHQAHRWIYRRNTSPLADNAACAEKKYQCIIRMPDKHPKMCIECRQQGRHTPKQRTIVTRTGCTSCNIHLCKCWCFRDFHAVDNFSD